MIKPKKVKRNKVEFILQSAKYGSDVHQDEGQIKASFKWLDNCSTKTKFYG